MKAMIFAAGLGTRLSPITQKIPKALAEIKGIPLLEIVIRRLIRYGYKDFIINVHHFGEEIEEFVSSKKQFRVNITFSDERDQLLDTGGGLKKASWFFNGSEPFLVHNVDVISNIDLNSLMQFHKQEKSLATLAVRSRPASRYLYFNSQNLLCGWENVKSGEKKIIRKDPTAKPFGFSGIHVIEPALFNLINESGKFSITEVYLRLSEKYPIKAFIHENDFWIDVGKPDNLAEAEKLLSKL
jgi:N-acetyl-alpha-D-muramate 1-phosphate uridylyltransferase